MENGITTPIAASQESLKYSYEKFIEMNERDACALVESAFGEFSKSKNEVDKDGKTFLALAARDGHPDKYVSDLARTRFWESQLKFCYQVLTEKYPTYSKHYPDMIQCIAADFFDKLPKYDPTKGAPGTYFKFYIIHAAYKYIIDLYPMVPEHRFPAFKALQAAADKLEQESTPITEENLHELCPEIGINTIAAFMPRLGPDAMVSLDELGDGIPVDKSTYNSIETPEEAIIKKERRESIVNGFTEAFSPTEFKVISYYFTNGCKLSTTKELLNNEDIFLEDDEIRSIVSDAQNKLTLVAMNLPRDNPFRQIIDGTQKNQNISVYAERHVNTEDNSEEFEELWVKTTEEVVAKKREEKAQRNEHNEQIEGQMVMSFAVDANTNIKSDFVYNAMEHKLEVSIKVDREIDEPAQLAN